VSSSLDTVNRLLLEGARRHARDAVFAHRAADGSWEETPDWRADRRALRVALALGEGLGVGSGDVVALFMPLVPDWPIVERGIWALGAVSLPVPYDWSLEEARRAATSARAVVVFCPSASRARELSFPEGTRALVAMEGEGKGALLGFGELMEQGGVLDTPERATRCRATARAVPREAPASMEPVFGPEGLSLERRTQGAWASDVEGFVDRFPPAGDRSLVSARPDPASRLVLYAGWADGRTRTVVGGIADTSSLVFGREADGAGEGSFVNLSELERRTE
jgi:hypothetical protein